MPDANIIPLRQQAPAAANANPRELMNEGGLRVTFETAPQFCSAGVIAFATVNKLGDEIELIGADELEAAGLALLRAAKMARGIA